MASEWDAATISNLGSEIAGIDVVVVQKEIMVAAEEVSVIPNLVRNHPFAGAGMVLEMPYVMATEWNTAALTEGAQTTHAVTDINQKVITMAKYVFDWPISLEGVHYGAVNPIPALTRDAGRGYAKKISGLIHTEINGVTNNGMDVTDTGDIALDNLVALKEKFLTAQVPGPHYLVLHPEHWTDLVSAAQAVTALVNPTPVMGATIKNGYLGNIAGFECYIDPFANGSGANATVGTAATSVAFGSEGIYWVYKPTAIPNAANGAFAVEIEWNREWRSYVLAGTFIGAAAVVRSDENATEWAANLYLTA